MHRQIRRPFAALITLLLAIAACREAPPLQIPEPLVGLWMSADGRYADRFFEITDAFIAFEMANGRVDYYAHRSLDREGTPAGTLYTLRYSKQSGGKELQFTFYLRGGQLRPKNQPTVKWERVAR